MYVFGVDIPLVEIFFVMAGFVVIMIALLVYLTAKVHQMNRRILRLTADEKKDVGSLRAIEGDMLRVKNETEQDICLLSNIKDELDKVLRTSWKGVVVEKEGLQRVRKHVHRKLKEKQKKHRHIAKQYRLPQYSVSYVTKYRQQEDRK